MTIKDVVAENIKAIRIDRGLSQASLSEATGIDVRVISRMETQPQNLTLETLGLLADALNVNHEEIFAGWRTKANSKEDLALRPQWRSIYCSHCVPIAEARLFFSFCTPGTRLLRGCGRQF